MESAEGNWAGRNQAAQMSLYLLDTNVVSEGWKPKPDPKVEQFVADVEWLIPVVVIAEIQEGAESHPSPARKAAINGRLDAFVKYFDHRVAWWDTETARTWGRLKHSIHVKHQPQALWDSLIEAAAVRFDATIATRNKGDFRHARTIDPWLEDPPV